MQQLPLPPNRRLNHFSQKGLLMPFEKIHQYFREKKSYLHLYPLTLCINLIFYFSVIWHSPFGFSPKHHWIILFFFSKALNVSNLLQHLLIDLVCEVLQKVIQAFISSHVFSISQYQLHTFLLRDPKDTTHKSEGRFLLRVYSECLSSGLLGGSVG